MQDLPITWRDFLSMLLEGLSGAPVALPTESADIQAPPENCKRAEGKKITAPPARFVAYQAVEAQGQFFVAGQTASKEWEQVSQPFASAEEATGKCSELTWRGIVAAINKVEGYTLNGVGVLRSLVGDESGADDDLREQSPEKRLFFLVEYEPNEVIAAAGSHSDYASLLVQGAVRIVPRAVRVVAAQSCWKAPMGPRMQRWWSRFAPWNWFETKQRRIMPTVPLDRDSGSLSGISTEQGFIVSLWTQEPSGSASRRRDFAERLMGLTSVVWKQPRTATLAAQNDEQGAKCRMLLIKRVVLRDCLLFADKDHTKLSELYCRKMDLFLRESLPALLAQNRLFRPLFYVEEIDDAKALRNLLVKPNGSAAARVSQRVETKVRAWLKEKDLADDATRYRLVSSLNDVLDDRDLYDASVWPAAELPAEAASLVQKAADERSLLDTYRLNRFCIEHALPGAFRSICRPQFESALDFGAMVEILRSQAGPPLPVRPSPGDIVLKSTEAPDGLYLILEGRIRLTLDTPHGAVPFNHLIEKGFFGEGCLAADGERAHYGAEATSNCNLLKIETAAVRALADRFPTFGDKLARETARMRRRAEQARLGHRVPPAELTPEIAAKLMRGTNLLVIDMDRCTRCDQCVHGCTAAHQGQPRFHRANPGFRVGRYEIAAACMHCADAPCLEECPVGAITLFENGSVQVLRDRCITCRKCETGCPYGVIEYHPPIDEADGASAKAIDYNVTHKCDLCLTPDRDPPCVVACPYGAAQRGGPSDFFPGLKSMARFIDPD